MMSTSPETSTRTTGAHRAHREARDRAAARAVAQRPPTRYEPYLDGLFTYCMSVLCDHDAATAALADVLALAERRRGPDEADDRRARLYALARWACLRRLAEVRQKRPGTHASARPPAHGDGTGKPRAAKTAAGSAALPEDEERRRRRELALLAWPEAAGTTPEQREALELAVRHQLTAHEVADVLGMDPAAARELLASAACEVERTRAALAVVETGACPGVARLTGDQQLVLSATLRRELVRHVDDCPVCRRAAERAVPGRWPGTSVTPAALPVLEAPRAALGPARAHLTRARGGAPRFDRRGFPMDPRDHAARRDRLRARAVTTTVVATVVAAPVFALWAAYRAAPLIGEGGDGRSVSAGEEQGDGTVGDGSGDAYENAASARTRPGARPHKGKHAADDVSVEVTQGKGRGALSVAAANDGDTTLITLRATGDSPVRWSARTGADWLYLSQSSGTLEPGESATIKVYVDQLSEPAGYWTAQVSLAPSGAVVRIEGYGPVATPPVDSRPTPPDPDPGPPRPTAPPPAPDPEPTPTGPAQPDPTPTPTDQAPTDPPGPTPPPSDGGGDPPPAT
ncbi:BACON domain-containing protein [Streptomyces europaeiscabiei]|uniref:BACON domain-containing protein n=1 Tax=Streptomyces europaeiscabiei TaxID=146819 RepID=UPI0038F5E817